MNTEFKNWLSLRIISFIVVLLLISFLFVQKLFAEKNETFVEPVLIPVIITDGLGAKIFVDQLYEVKTFNEGYKGYEKVVKVIKNNPNREKLAVNLNCLSAFYAGYKLLFEHDMCSEILNVLNKLLNSNKLDDVQAAVTEIYYGFDIHSSNQTENIVDSLERLRKTSEDEYTVRFATLCLNKMYSPRPITKEKYPVPPRTK
ncbi:MAG: hypothetical protein PF692_00285 [Kiritimatiellae bacterium]|nr:hypothetical protein [Kiritimatiellia bacterium]